MCADRSSASRAAALGFALAVVCSEALGGTVVDREQKVLDTSLADSSSMQNAPRQSGRGAGPTLRCWQYGRLVLEESGVALPSAEKGMKPLVFPRQEGRADSVYVFDLNQGMCTITGTAPPSDR